MIYKNKVILICLLVLFVLFSSNSFAQTQTKGSSGGMGYFAIGLTTFDIDDLNARLTALGYPEFSSGFISIGGGGHAIINKFVIGGEGHVLTGDEESATINSQPFKTSLTGGYGLIHFGYLVYSNSSLNVYPLLGAGLGGITFKIAENSAPSFEQILNDPKRSVELNYGGMIATLSVNLDYIIKLKETEDGFGGIIIGLQAGYMFAPFTNDWKMDEHDISGGPAVGLNGPFVRITIGGGGMSK